MGNAVTDSKNFAEMLLREGLITEAQYDEGQKEYQSASGERSLSRIFVEMGAITEGARVGVLQKKLECKVANLAEVVPRPDAAREIPRSTCEKHHMVPLRIENNRLVLAMEDPTDPRAVTAAEAATNLPLKLLLGKASEIADAIRAMPDVAPKAAAAGPSAAKRMVGLIGLILACFVPMGAFILLLIYSVPFQTKYRELALEPFEQVLFFVLGWCAWAIIAYWVHDVIFGESEEDD